jgi:hypothetical protein
MLRIITLLNQKNHYLEKFYSLNEKELINFAQGDFGNLESFYQMREKILELIKYLDSEVEQTRQDDHLVEKSDRVQIRELLAIKEEYVSRILAQDLEVLQCIESTKSSIIRELQDLKRNRKVVGSYKSRTFGHKLDEKA